MSALSDLITKSKIIREDKTRIMIQDPDGDRFIISKHRLEPSK